MKSHRWVPFLVPIVLPILIAVTWAVFQWEPPLVTETGETAEQFLPQASQLKSMYVSIYQTDKPRREFYVDQDRMREILRVLGKARRIEIRDGYDIKVAYLGQINCFDVEDREIDMAWHGPSDLPKTYDWWSVVGMKRLPSAGFSLGKTEGFDDLNLTEFERILETAYQRSQPHKP
jgi:hypothetical protein